MRDGPHLGSGRDFLGCRFELALGPKSKTFDLI